VTVQNIELAAAIGECYAALGAENVGLAEVMKARLQHLENGPGRTKPVDPACVMSPYKREGDDRVDRQSLAKVQCSMCKNNLVLVHDVFCSLEAACEVVTGGFML
jgi:hypothetical protein